MGLIEFLKEHRECLNIRGIENRLGIRDNFLRDVLADKRILPDNYGVSLIDYFGEYGVSLSYKAREKRSKAVVPFDLEGWTKVYGRCWEKGERMVKLDSEGFYECDVN